MVRKVLVGTDTSASADLAALDLTPPGIGRTGRTILYELAACIGDTAAASDPVHRQLAAYWGLDDKGADLVRRCLVLLADHELNASTFVARCVASTGATPYAVVSAALSALSGRRHGGASARGGATNGIRLPPTDFSEGFALSGWMRTGGAASPSPAARFCNARSR